jgi:hypothetical protein
MYISLTSGRPDPSSFKIPIQIATEARVERNELDEVGWRRV